MSPCLTPRPIWSRTQNPSVKSTMSATTRDILRKLPDAVVLETVLDDVSDQKPFVNRYLPPKFRSCIPKTWHKRCQTRVKHALHQCVKPAWSKDCSGSRTCCSRACIIFEKTLYKTFSEAIGLQFDGLDRSPLLGNIVNNVVPFEASRYTTPTKNPTTHLAHDTTFPTRHLVGLQTCVYEVGAMQSVIPTL